MDDQLQLLLKKLMDNEFLSIRELKELKASLTDSSKRQEINQWLSDCWPCAAGDDVAIDYNLLKQRIRKFSTDDAKKNRKLITTFSVFTRYYRQIAAFLFVPLLIGSLCLMGDHVKSANKFIARAPLGQKAEVELPDGSMVWLNSGSQISYLSSYNRKIREIRLQGEAYFEVKKNTGKPFFVRTSSLDVEVTGTKFDLNAYSDDPIIETSLVEGHVNLFAKDIPNKKYELTAGHVITYSKATKSFSRHNLDKDAAIGWKDNRLIFINDDFYKLARKIERWYNMKVIYNPADFKKNKLTVKLLEGEQLGKLLQIIDSAIGVECTVSGDKIYITKKQKEPMS